MSTTTQRMLAHLEILPELGRQRCFERGNPFYYQDADDALEPGNEQGTYWRKELLTGEMFLVTLEVTEVKGETYAIKDTIIRQLR